MNAGTFDRVVIAACHIGAAACFAVSFYYMVILSSYDRILHGVGFFGGAVGLEVIAALIKRGKGDGPADS